MSQPPKPPAGAQPARRGKRPREGPVGARAAAAELVAAVADRGRSLDDALAENARFDALEGRDRGFARAIASTTLRRLGGVDAVLSQFVQRPLPEQASLARAILRTGAAQMLWLDVAPHAAVSESVTLANAASATRSYAALINAVLRKVARDGPAIAASLPPGAHLPEWLFARWRAAYGDERADAIARASGEEAPLDITVRADAAGWAERLGGAVVADHAVRLAASADVTTLPGFAEGAWWVQDIAASAPVRLLGDVAGLEAIDLCAAPGGKTLQLAAAGAQVTALDSSASRLARVAENLERTGLQARLVAADARDWNEGKSFDIVLLDAPCTATGTLRRRPDVAWLRRPDDVRKLATLQADLLDRAIAMTRPGGRTLYAVCSLEPEEGEGVIEAALARHGGSVTLAAPFHRTTPADDPGAPGGQDGFFACVLQKSTKAG